MKLLIFIFLLNFDAYNLDAPPSACYPDRPLRTKDHGCTNFDEICLKKDDLDCNNFKSACKQCPASNYSILMLMDIINVKDQINATNLRLNSLEAQLESNKKETIYMNKRQNEIFILLCFVIVTLVICIVLLICEIKFNLLTKLCNVRSKSSERKKKYSGLKNVTTENSSLINSSQEFFVSLETKIDSKMKEAFTNMEILLDQKIISKMNEIFEKMTNLLDPKATKTKFRVEGYENLFYVNFDEDDTIVKVKRDLCEKLSKDFKIMKMKLNGKILDDNNILFSEIGTLNYSIVIDCYFDNQIKSNEIIVVNVGCKSMSPKLIQIRKKQTIEDLKTILSRFHKTKDFIILKGSIELDEKKSINDLQLIDDDSLTVIEIETKQLKVSSVFDDETIVKIEYSTKDKVENLKKYIAHKNGSDPSLYILFIKNKCLNEDKYLYEYDIENELSVQYCCLKRLDGLTIGQRLHQGKIAELFSGTDEHINKEILLLKYDVLSELKMKENKHILKELEVFQIAKLHERFVKLLDIYHKDNIVYVSMENMSKGTVNMYMEKNSPLNLMLIQRWSMQILEGLQHLHNHQLILRDLNPNTILVDKDDNVKLYSFNVSKYKEFLNPSKLSIDEESPGFHVRYFAPEIFLQESCGPGTDIWSLGAVLIKLSTGKSPLEELNKYDITNKYRKSKYIEYELPTDKNNRLFKDFIDLCLTPLETRATVTILKNHRFMKNI